MNSFIELFWSKKEELWILFLQHINMTTIAVLISLAVGVPVGILITRNKTAAGAALTIANLMQSIPCLALLAISVIFIGIGTKPAIMMVFVYAFLPILKNTYTGIMSVDPKNIEVARGIGLSRWKCLFEIEIPIAAPFIMSGIRIAAVAAVGTMTIAAFAGAKGLGWFINLGLNSLNYQLILLGAIPVSALALLVDFIFGRLERAITSEGLLAPEQGEGSSLLTVWNVYPGISALLYGSLIRSGGSNNETISNKVMLYTGGKLNENKKYMVPGGGSGRFVTQRLQSRRKKGDNHRSQQFYRGEYSW